MPLASGTYTRADGTGRTGDSIRQEQQADSTGVDPILIDAEANDLVAALETALFRDGQNAATGNIPFGGNKPTGLGASTADGEAVIYDQMAWTTNSTTPTNATGSGPGSVVDGIGSSVRTCNINDVAYVSVVANITTTGSVYSYDYTLPFTVARTQIVPIVAWDTAGTTLYNYFARASGTALTIMADTLASSNMAVGDLGIYVNTTLQV